MGSDDLCTDVSCKCHKHRMLEKRLTSVLVCDNLCFAICASVCDRAVSVTEGDTDGDLGGRLSLNVAHFQVCDLMSGSLCEPVY